MWNSLYLRGVKCSEVSWSLIKIDVGDAAKQIIFSVYLILSREAILVWFLTFSRTPSRNTGFPDEFQVSLRSQKVEPWLNHSWLKENNPTWILQNSPLSVGVWRRPSCLLALVARTNMARTNYMYNQKVGNTCTLNGTGQVQIWINHVLSTWTQFHNRLL